MIRVEALSSALPPDLGSRLLGRMAELLPICRSITGDGLRATLRAAGETLPLEIHEVPSGTAVFDWTVPREWNVREAYVADARGRRVIDFAEHTLHVVNYSVPVRARMSLAELRPHLHSLPDHPDWIPYRTSYYRETWGFCLRHRDLLALEEGEYEVVIDSELSDGSLSYGEILLPGESAEEILLTTHACHPQMCNDNLSGVTVLAAIAAALHGASRRLSYRILFLPGTIGAITWLALHREQAQRIRAGVVLAGVGDRGPASFKLSRRGDTEIDRAMRIVLRDTGREHRILPFSPYGYDERQFCSPGFDLAVGRFSRSEYGSYPEYHTSADDLDFVSAEALVDSARIVLDVLGVLETDGRFVNALPWCEPQLGKRGLYSDREDVRMAVLWVLNQSDGTASLVDIAERSGVSYAAVLEAARALHAGGLLEESKGIDGHAGT